jgi:hypothetical protein
MHQTSIVVRGSEILTTDYEVSGWIPGTIMGFFFKGKDSHGDHCTGSLVELRFKILRVT